MTKTEGDLAPDPPKATRSGRFEACGQAAAEAGFRPVT